MPISRQMDKEAWYIYTRDYYSAIKHNSFESVLIRWMKLEPIIQSEVSQKDQGLLKRVSSSHQVAKVLEFQLQHQSYQ